MKTHSSLSSLLVLCATLLAAPAFASESSASDLAAQQLATRGAVPVQAAGPHVARGTFRIQVSTKLGRPDVELADGTWLYQGRSIEGSAARGTLVVRFAQGRVSELALVTPAAVAALRADPRRPLANELVAAK